MFEQIISPLGFTLEIITDTDSSLQVTERVSEHSPKLMVMSVLPREGMSLGRYLLRQLRIRFADTPIVVGRWGRPDDLARDSAKLVELGASDVVGTLADASARVQKLAIPAPKTATVAPAVGRHEKSPATMRLSDSTTADIRAAPCQAGPSSRLFERLCHDVPDAFFGNMRGQVSPCNDSLKLVFSVNDKETVKRMLGKLRRDVRQRSVRRNRDDFLGHDLGDRSAIQIRVRGHSHCHVTIRHNPDGLPSVDHRHGSALLVTEDHGRFQDSTEGGAGAWTGRHHVGGCQRPRGLIWHRRGLSKR